MSSQPSLVTSFKGNRFNNLFEAASALHFHRQHLVEFFTIYMADRNQKLESVLNDAESDSVAVYVLATDVPQGDRVILETPWVQDPLLGLLPACC